MKKKLLLFALFLLFGALTSNSQITITLRKSFIDSFKNRVTTIADYEIYFAHPHPNQPKNDADLHFSGFDKKIGLPIVAEIMNAKEFGDAVDEVHNFEGKGKPQNKVKLTGVWRLWCEHPGGIDEFVQGKFTQKVVNETIENTNPPHVFEIHPIIKINSIDVSGSIHKINGYTYKTAEDAFDRYSNLKCKLKNKPKTISIETNTIGFNYVDFWVQLKDTSMFMVPDGLFAFCSVFDSDFNPEEGDEEKLVHHKVRVAFIKGTDVYEKVKGMHKGDFLHLSGIPRINLNLIFWRAANAKKRPEVLEWNLPFELVAVGEL